jgi:hypothetical protein
VAMTAVSSAKVAVMESGEVGRSAVYRKYSKGPRTLPPSLSLLYCLWLRLVHCSEYFHFHDFG